jgi:hypothetical protein
MFKYNIQSFPLGGRCIGVKILLVTLNICLFLLPWIFGTIFIFFLYFPSRSSSIISYVHAFAYSGFILVLVVIRNMI